MNKVCTTLKGINLNALRNLKDPCRFQLALIDEPKKTGGMETVNEKPSRASYNTSTADFADTVKERILQECRTYLAPAMYEILKDHLEAGGRFLRSRMVYDLAEIFHVPASLALDWAAALESLHNASLIHDDLQDGDLFRRSQPTIWYRHGASQALNGGDALLMIGPRIVCGMETQAEKKVRLIALYSELTLAMTQGQCLEEKLIHHLDAENVLELYLQAVTQKTSQLFETLYQGVSILTDPSSTATDQNLQGFHRLGVLFQVQDDLVDLFGEKGRGEVGCDIKEGKISYLVVTYLGVASPEEKRKLGHILRKDRKNTTQDDILWVYNEFVEKKVMQRTADFIHEEIRAILFSEVMSQHVGLRSFTYKVIQAFLQPIDHVPEVAKVKESLS